MSPVEGTKGLIQAMRLPFKASNHEKDYIGFNWSAPNIGGMCS